MRYLVRNKTYQTIQLIEGKILSRGSIITDTLTNQIKNLERKGILKSRKVK